jgi:hypothetical protein
MISGRHEAERATLPTWAKPQLAALVKEAPDRSDWLHEIKLDGYRMHARLDARRVLTRRGNIWTDKYPAIAQARGWAARGERLPRDIAHNLLSTVSILRGWTVCGPGARHQRSIS